MASFVQCEYQLAMLRKFLLGIKQVLGNNPEGANVDQAVAALVSLSQIPGFTPARPRPCSSTWVRVPMISTDSPTR